MSPLLVALALATAPPGCPEPPAENAVWCAALAARPRLPLPTREDCDALEAVYARPELRRARTDAAGFRRALAGLWARFMELLGSAEAERYASVGRMVFLLAALAAATAGLAALRRRRLAAPRAPEDSGVERAPLPPPDRSALLAEAALAHGDPREALRHAFLSALAAIEEAGLLPRDRTLTNGELVRRLAVARVPLASELGALGHAFDAAIYGGATVRDREARAALDAATWIRAQARGGR